MSHSREKHFGGERSPLVSQEHLGLTWSRVSKISDDESQLGYLFSFGNFGSDVLSWELRFCLFKKWPGEFLSSGKFGKP